MLGILIMWEGLIDYAIILSSYMLSRGIEDDFHKNKLVTLYLVRASEYVLISLLHIALFYSSCPLLLV